MFDDFDTCVHYLEARVYHSINKSDSQTEAIHLKSLPHKCSSTNKPLPPGLKSSWIKLSQIKSLRTQIKYFFMLRIHDSLTRSSFAEVLFFRMHFFRRRFFPGGGALVRNGFATAWYIHCPDILQDLPITEYARYNVVTHEMFKNFL